MTLTSSRRRPIEPLEPRTMLAYVPRVVGYFPEYRWSSFPSIDLDAVGHINYFSISASTTGSLSTANINTTHLATLVSAAHAKNVTVSITVGPQSFATIAGSSSALSAFVTNMVNFCQTWNLDGIDLDWEPSPGTNVAAYKTLIDALYVQTNPRGLYLSAAVNPLNKEIPVAAVPEMNWINVMCYDFDYANHSTLAASTSAMNSWNTWGVPKNKLIMGMPFYGRAGTSWSNTVPETYADIVDRYTALYGAAPAPSVDSASLSFSGAVGGASSTWYWNGRTTIQSKANFVTTNGFGGAMIWELGQDHFTAGQYDATSLLPVLKTALAPATSFATLDGSGDLVVEGNRTNENVTLSLNGSNLVVTRGGNTETFALSSVNNIVVNGGGGNDTLNVNSVIGKPIAYNGGPSYDPSNPLASPDTLNVNAGTFTFNADAQATTANLTINVATGASVIFNSTQHLLALNLNGGVASVGANGGRTIVTRALSVSGSGKLDLADNALILDYTGTSPAASIRSWISAGRASGGWDGTTGLTSSTAAASVGSAHPTAIGYAEASNLFSAFPATFFGNSVDNTSVLVRHTLAGDSDLSGTVDLTDFTFLAANFNATGSSWLQGDYNYDGTVDLTDFTYLATNFNQSLIAGGGSPGSVAVPLATVQPTTPAQAPVWSERPLAQALFDQFDNDALI
jgi:hypothetical protein